MSRGPCACGHGVELHFCARGKCEGCSCPWYEEPASRRLPVVEVASVCVWCFKGFDDCVCDDARSPGGAE